MSNYPAPHSARTGFWDRVKEVSLFFAGRDKVHQTTRRIVKDLEKAKIPYAIVGGMAVNAHGHERTTKDVDILLTPEGFADFQRRFVGKRYELVAGRRRFIDQKSGVGVDVLVTGLFPGSGRPGPIAYPDPTAVAEIIDTARVVKLSTLIELKLAARRYQDFADVVNLIAVHNLDESYQQHLNPSVHRDYIE